MIGRAFDAGWLRLATLAEDARVAEFSALLDAGEAEAIALCLRAPVRFLLIDEARGREVARRAGIPVVGVAGVLLAAKANGHLSAVGPLLEDRTHFFGFIKKADGTWRAGSLEVQPRIKSEYLNQTPFILDGDGRREWTGTGILLLRHPMLGASSLEAGLEYHRVADLMLDEKGALAANRVGATGDSRSLVLAAQWSTVGDYQGYTLITRFGIMYTRAWDEFITAGGQGASVKEDRGRELSTTFITINAGL